MYPLRDLLVETQLSSQLHSHLFNLRRNLQGTRAHNHRINHLANLVYSQQTLLPLSHLVSLQDSLLSCPQDNPQLLQLYLLLEVHRHNQPCNLRNNLQVVHLSLQHGSLLVNQRVNHPVNHLHPLQDSLHPLLPCNHLHNQRWILPCNLHHSHHHNLRINLLANHLGTLRHSQVRIQPCNLHHNHQCNHQVNHL